MRARFSLYLKVAILAPEPVERTLHTIVVYAKLRFFSWGCGKRSPRAVFVPKSYAFATGAAGALFQPELPRTGRVEPATARSRKQAGKPWEDFERPFHPKVFLYK